VNGSPGVNGQQEQSAPNVPQVKFNENSVGGDGASLGKKKIASGAMPKSHKSLTGEELRQSIDYDASFLSEKTSSAFSFPETEELSFKEPDPPYAGCQKGSVKGFLKMSAPNNPEDSKGQLLELSLLMNAAATQNPNNKSLDYGSSQKNLSQTSKPFDKKPSNPKNQKQSEPINPNTNGFGKMKIKSLQSQ
jgi:hypothetical protein